MLSIPEHIQHSQVGHMSEEREKLQHRLEHWAEHNREHAETLRKHLPTAERINSKTADHMRRASELMNKASEQLEAARDAL